MLRMWLGLPFPSIASIPRCVCTHPIDTTCVHLLCHAHGNECTWTHDAVHDTFVTITKDLSFHVGWEQLHTFPSTTFHFYQHYVHQRRNSHPSRHCHCKLNTSGFTSLIMHNLKICCLRSNSSQRKEVSQSIPHWPFLPLSNWGVWMSNKQADVFLHNYANAMWNIKRLEGPPLFILVTFLYQKIQLHCKECKHFPS